MTALKALRRVARGERLSGELLPPCRLEAFGSEFFGEEAVVQSFRQAPLNLSEDAAVVETPRNLAVVEGETVLIADVFGGAILRLWRLGDGRPVPAEPSIDVPFDADLVQSRGDFGMRAEDHPDLTAEAETHVQEIGRSICRQGTVGGGLATYRSRAFLVRAFNDGCEGAALFAVHSFAAKAVRSAGFTYAAALFRYDRNMLLTQRLVGDPAGEAAITAKKWRPRIG